MSDPAHQRLKKVELWSSETLVTGMRSVATQPDGLLVKTEEDETMMREYAVTCP